MENLGGGGSGSPCVLQQRADVQAEVEDRQQDRRDKVVPWEVSYPGRRHSKAREAEQGKAGSVSLRESLTAAAGSL